MPIDSISFPSPASLDFVGNGKAVPTHATDAPTVETSASIQHGLDATTVGATADASDDDAYANKVARVRSALASGSLQFDAGRIASSIADGAHEYARAGS